MHTFVSHTLFTVFKGFSNSLESLSYLLLTRFSTDWKCCRRKDFPKFVALFSGPRTMPGTGRYLNSMCWVHVTRKPRSQRRYLAGPYKVKFGYLLNFKPAFFLSGKKVPHSFVGEPRIPMSSFSMSQGPETLVFRDRPHLSCQSRQLPCDCVSHPRAHFLTLLLII